MARMIAADRDYVLSKYKLHKLRDLENLVAEAVSVNIPSTTLSLVSVLSPTRLVSTPRLFLPTHLPTRFLTLVTLVFRDTFTLLTDLLAGTPSSLVLTSSTFTSLTHSARKLPTRLRSLVTFDL